MLFEISLFLIPKSGGDYLRIFGTYATTHNIKFIQSKFIKIISYYFIESINLAIYFNCLITHDYYSFYSLALALY
jgi:hypothetical protein